MRILILVDGNHKIGLGHVYRSLNLAKFLKNQKHEVFIFTKDNIAKNIISKTVHCKFYRNLCNEKIIKFLDEFCPDITIVDKLNETKKNLMILRKLNTKIIAIDYTGKHKELFHYGINYMYPKTGISNNSYSGFQYSIINENFLNYTKKKILKNAKSILVLQGGADTYCFTPKIIKALNEINSNFRISVVLGPSFKCWSKLNYVLKKCRNPVKIYHNVKNMAPIMKQADLAITAAGHTLLELAHLGIPSLVICAEEFENETANLMEKNGFGKNLGFGRKVTTSKIKSNVNNILADYDTRKKMNKIGSSLIDGKGTERIAKILQTLIFK